MLPTDSPSYFLSLSFSYVRKGLQHEKRTRGLNEQKIKLAPMSCVPADSTLPSVTVQNLKKPSVACSSIFFFSSV